MSSGGNRRAEGFHYASRASAARPITGFDYVVRVDRWQSDTVSIEGHPLSYAYDEQAARFRVRWGGRQEVVLPVRPLLERLRSRSKADSGALPPEALRLEAADQGVSRAD